MSVSRNCVRSSNIFIVSDDEEEELEEEADDFRRLRLKTARLLEAVPQLDITHKIAHFLHPKYRELLLLRSQTDREEVSSATPFFTRL